MKEPMPVRRAVVALAVAGLVGVAVLLGVAAVMGFAGKDSAAADYSFAVFGDIPYGEPQLSAFPARIAQINADPDVRLATHLGDIGSGNCSDSYYSTIRSLFDRFDDGLVYTPGDNEWADCHRADVGQGAPLDRLAAVRTVFFPEPGRTLGRNPLPVAAQPGYPENVTFSSAGVTFAAVHLVGSNNDLDPWSGLGFSRLLTERLSTTAQRAEESERVNAAVAHIQATFASAKSANSRAVVLLTQADMFAEGARGRLYRTAYQRVVASLASESRQFQRPVFLFNGDSHAYVRDKPLTSPEWLSFYGITESAPNLNRITIQGGHNAQEWLKVDVVSTDAILRIHRVPYE
jgi:hypothetical protein